LHYQSLRLEIIKKVDAQSYMMHKKVMEQLRIPMSALDYGKQEKHTSAMCHYSSRQKIVKNFYEKTESAHLE
jgi:hypothetical protein